MPEANPGIGPGGQDPTLPSIEDVIETLAVRPESFGTAEGLGVVATASAAEAVSPEIADPAEEAAQTPEIVHERPTPPHWDELVAFAETLPIFKHVDKYGAKYVDESVDALRAKLEELLDNDALDEHRYYSIGMLLCGIARGIQDPDRRDQAVKLVGERLVSNWSLQGTAHPNGLMPEDVDGNATSCAFGAMVNEVASELPPHVQLLHDVLEWHVSERRFSLRDGKPASDRGYLGKQGPPGDSHYPAGVSAQRTGQVATVAVARVLRDVLKRRAKYLADKDPDFPAEATAQQVIDHTDMDDINLIQVAQRAAAVRIDELRDLENVLLDLDENGRALFHGKKLPRSRDLGPSALDAATGLPVSIHTRRLRCPALFVSGLIPDMLSCMIDGIKVADDKIRYQRENRGW